MTNSTDVRHRWRGFPATLPFSRVLSARLLLAASLVTGSSRAADYYPIVEVTVDTENDLWPISNLIQGPETGFDASEPHDQPGGGSDTRWVTADDAGFPSDYPEEVQQPVIQLDLGEDRTLNEISVWGYSSGNSNGTSQFSLRFATDAEGSSDGLFGTVDYSSSITYNPTFELFSDPVPQQYKLFDETVVARYVEFTNLDNFFIAPGDGSEPLEEPLPRLLPVLPGGDRVGLGEIGFIDLPDDFEPGDLIPRTIGGDEFGTYVVDGSRTSLTFGPAGDPEPGLAQEWYATSNPGSKAGLDDVFASSSPVIPAFRGASSWWTGSSQMIEDIPTYPQAIVDDGTITGDNYAVRATGEILIEESGTYQFTDGIDDYTYFALDLDGSGVAGDSDDEILIDDNDWTDVLTGANGGSPIVEVEFEDIGEDGEWIPLEFNMAEGGGGDSGVIYWDYSPDDGAGGYADFFPFEPSEPLFDEIDAAMLLIPDTHLRSSISELVAADAEGSLGDMIRQTDVLELQLQVGPTGNDQIALADLTVGEGIGSLDVSDVTVRIVVEGELTEGTEFQIFAADSVVGLETLNLLLDDPSMWDLSGLSEGLLTFGPGGGTGLLGDLDMNGEVDFPDFLMLSGMFNQAVDPPGSGADLNADGTVDFADFLILSGNFGTSAAVTSVPEPGSHLLCLTALVVAGLLRRPNRRASETRGKA